MPGSSRRVLLCMASALSCVAAFPAHAEDRDARPGAIVRTRYDGVTNDLLTAGLGRSGLQAGASAPGFADPLRPTAEELRRLAIFANYRALLDVSPGGGFGTLYGPNVLADGTVTAGEGLIAGEEVLAYRGGRNGAPVTVMVQIPDSFDPARSCIVTAPSSGSRGIYGAIGTAGEWGLKNGCAVAYTDKGTGTGAEDLQRGQADLIRGEFVPVEGNRRDVQFTAGLSDGERAAFNTAAPNRFAFKHAHSRANPEADWGRNVLDSIRFAFEVLDASFPAARINRRNTVVIASSVSNGGGASLLAAEQDGGRLIDGVAVAEPNVNPAFDGSFTIDQAGRAPLVQHSRTLLDYATLQNVYVGCAAVAPSLATAPLNLAASPARCASLADAGLLRGATLDEQAADAQRILNEFGILPEQNGTAPLIWTSYVPQSLSVTYANAYGRFGVTDALCGYSFAATAAAPPRVPVPLPDAALAALFSTSNGIPPTGGVNLINDLAPGGAQEDRSSTPDQNLRGALCLRSLALGRDAVTGAPLSPAMQEQAERIQRGVAAVRATGDLRGIPTLIVTGRGDNILPPNFTSRAYLGLNRAKEGARSRLSYIEVTNAQHLDTIVSLPGLDSTFVPLHRYFIQALDLMLAHLRTGAPLPPSQVVHTIPRGTLPGATTAPPLTAANVPPIAAEPGADAITFVPGAVLIPE